MRKLVEVLVSVHSTIAVLFSTDAYLLHKSTRKSVYKGCNLMTLYSVLVTLWCCELFIFAIHYRLHLNKWRGLHSTSVQSKPLLLYTLG